jgi:hypothetical protein
MNLGIASRSRARRRRHPIFRRRATIPTLVIVDDRRIRTRLPERPQPGASLDVGTPVVVTATKDVAGGGLIVAAQVVSSVTRRTGSHHRRS